MENTKTMMLSIKPMVGVVKAQEQNLPQVNLMVCFSDDQGNNTSLVSAALHNNFDKLISVMKNTDSLIDLANTFTSILQESTGIELIVAPIEHYGTFILDIAPKE